MASVQELIDAANAEKSPAISAMEGLARGYLSGQQQSLERAKTLIMLEQNRREQEMKFREHEMMIENQKKLSAQMAAQVDAARKKELKGAGANPEAVTQQMKTKDVWERNEKGQLSLKTEVSPTDSNEQKTLESILTGKVNAGEISLEDAYKLKAMGNPGSFQPMGMQGGNPVFYNPKTTETKLGKLPGSGPLMSTTQTEGQANAALYGDRAEQAHKQIEDIASQLNLSSASVAIQGKLPNPMKSSSVQQFEQAKRNFINAQLRRESGAAIQPSEFDSAEKQYFPQFGDSDEVLAQKKINRETAIAGLRNAAGITMLNGSAGGNKMNSSPNNPPTISSQAQYDALPPGTAYLGPDGTPHRKK